MLQRFGIGLIPPKLSSDEKVLLDSINESKSVFTLEEQNKFLNAIKGNRDEVLYRVAFSTGLRLGELLGLKWSDIDFKNGTLTVNRTLQRVTEISRDGNRESKIIEQFPKTKNSIRTIPIPQNIISRLKDHKINQNKDKLKLGEAYFNNDYVFCDNLGYPIDDKRPARNLKSILTKINIEPIKFH